MFLLTSLALPVGCSSGESDSAPTTTLDPVSLAILEGNVAACQDGGFSDNTDFGGTCSSAGDVAEWLAPFGECADGTVIKMSEDASCPDDDFKGLLPRDYVPLPTDDDVALCNNGVFSDNTDFGGTCTSAGDVAQWLAPFGECADGTVIKMSEDASCPDDDFRGLLPPDFVPATTTAASTTTVPPATVPPATVPPATLPPATLPLVTAPPMPSETLSQQNARQMAADYLDYTAFSRTGLIKQLEFEGFTQADAAYGVDALFVDWNEQAAKMAAQYLDYTSFSRSGLVGQLVYEGFTQAQAEYGVSTTGL